ncbi:MAG: ribonuclease J [Clostridiales Family XIII bacterium]|nr:ribonuclease J [Clostridiales Family XIII bacterium]
MPLGGLNEIGKNMTAFEIGDNIIVIDCGMSFPDSEMFGIDVVIPDFSYIEENANRVRAIVLTHGHEDHIGGIPFLLKKLNVPIYGTPLTLGLVQSKLNEHGLRGKLKRIGAGQKIKIGPFEIEAIRVTHSIADCLCFAIKTPIGVIFHTGDFKIDYTPVDGDPIDFQKLAEIGSRGVHLMLSDSTNAVRAGYTQSERKLSSVLDSAFSSATGRIIIATFASNVHRIQTIIDTAVKNKRKVALSGRSMEKVLKLSVEMGYIKIPQNTLVDLNEIKTIPDHRLVIITTGSQGEPLSALVRMANHDHRAVNIKRGDRIILSSSPIPGNEKMVSAVIDKLFELGADVIYSDVADIHVSGHAREEELKLMLRLIKPNYFLPVHGEYRHMHAHALIAEDLGIPTKNIFVMRNGQILETDGKKISLSKKTVPADPVLVDNLKMTDGVNDIASAVLRDRKQLSESGMIIVAATLEANSNRLVSGPEILTRGFIYVRDNEDIMEKLKNIASERLQQFETRKRVDRSIINNAVRDDLRKFVNTKTKRAPIIMCVFME